MLHHKVLLQLTNVTSQDYVIILISTMTKSAKKQQSQVQTIQRRVPSRNVTQDNGNINKFWKGSRWFRCYCDTINSTVIPDLFKLILTTEIKGTAFGKLHLCPSN